MTKVSLALRFLLIVHLELVNIPLVALSTDSQPSTTYHYPGHLEPLGARNVKQSLEVIDDFVTPREFFEKYVSSSKPVLIRGGAKLSPAFSLWSDEYFLSFDESKNFQIVAEQRKKEIRTHPALDISFAEFVKTYEKSDIYLVNGVPPFLQKDVLLPPPLLCKDIAKDMLVDTVMWFSSGGTKSVLHNDDVDNINCLFHGTKELLFIEYKKYKDQVPIDFPSGGYSGVDVDSVDFVKYPSLKDVEYYNVTMEAGDCLFIPYKWFHQVRSFDRNIAVNVWWKHKTSFIPQDCIMEPNQTLDKFVFSSLQQETDNETDLISHLESLVADRKVGYTEFEKLVKQDSIIMNGRSIAWDEQFSSTTKKIFAVLDLDKSGKVSSSDLQLLREDSMSQTLVENEFAKIEDLVEDQMESNELDATENASLKDEL